MDKQQMEQAITTVAQGNFGALRIAMEITQQFGIQALQMLLASGVRKHFIWMLYKDYCGEDYGQMLHAIALGNIPQDIERVSDEYTTNFAETQDAFIRLVQDAIIKNIENQQ